MCCVPHDRISIPFKCVFKRTEQHIFFLSLLTTQEYTLCALCVSAQYYHHFYHYYHYYYLCYGIILWIHITSMSQRVNCCHHHHHHHMTNFYITFIIVCHTNIIFDESSIHCNMRIYYYILVIIIIIRLFVILFVRSWSWSSLN